MRKRQLTSMLLALLTAMPASVFAIGAKPGPLTVMQPDGTEVTILLMGHERNHCAYTSDGYLLTVDSAGYYVFADRNAEGQLIATTIRATAPESRTSELNALISRIDKEAVNKAFHQTRLPRNNGGRRGPGLFSSTFPTTGEQRGIAILVEFADKKFTIDDPKDYFGRMLNEEGFSDYGATGSARDYYIQNSCGMFSPSFDVYGPVTLANNYKYYGQNDSWGNDLRPGQMVAEACQLVDDDVDFTQYDRNGDGLIDNVYVFYAGYGEADGGGANTIWPHSWELSSAVPGNTYFFDDLRLEHYACSNELQRGNTPDGIGAFVHEFTHVMGFPDLYRTDGGTAFTPGEWDVMGHGSYNNNSRTPPNFSAYERYAFDWLEPQPIEKAGDLELLPLTDSNEAFIVSTANANEFFILENRQQTGNDKYLPGHGMLVWHIDFDQNVWDENAVNNNPNHQHVDIVEADGIKTEISRSGDTFPGTRNVTSFTATTNPAFVAWDKTPTPFDLYDIKESSAGIISMTVSDRTPTGISPLFRHMPFAVDGNTVRMTSGEATLHDLTGRKIAQLSNEPLSLPRGTYILNDGTTNHKFIIK